MSWNMCANGGVALQIEEKTVLGWVLILSLCALAAAVLGFAALTGMLAFAAKLVFLLLMALIVMSVVTRLMPRGPAR